jgi:hypothetical protein
MEARGPTLKIIIITILLSSCLSRAFKMPLKGSNVQEYEYGAFHGMGIRGGNVPNAALSMTNSTSPDLGSNTDL